ncbi:MAG TPA: aminoglycoside phosphotransferase family protein [Gaiellaceae bacterium]|nr:aminoglycoside phosphotransferase family protein [Gaiellaceae bacterium]
MTRLTDLTEVDLARALRTQFRIDATSIVPTETGQDVHARRYRVDSSYFVKVRPASDAREGAASLSRYLHDHGVPHVVAPLRSSTGSLTVQEGEHSLTVYPLIDGVTGMEVGLTERQWRAFGSFLKGLHATTLPAELAERVAFETYRPAELDLLPRIDVAVSARDADEMVTFWSSHRDEIFALATRTEELGQALKERALPLVLCHADLHTNNVIIDRDGELWVIDWDEPAHAPKERDLMFVVGGIHTSFVQPRETAWFLEGYGGSITDPLALAYYRHAWAVQDIGGYGKQVFLDSRLDERYPEARWRLESLFGPGSIVEIARDSVQQV